MLQSEVEKNASAKGFIFDGFPRTAAQAEALDKFLSTKKSAISTLVSLEVEEEELKRRLLERGKTSGRADDVDPNVIQKRIQVYKSETTPVKEYYRKQNKTAEINGIGTIENIFQDICKKIDAVA
jgi:adenylate kinase